MKRLFKAFIIMASIGSSLHAEAIPDISADNIDNYEALADINPDDIPADESITSKTVKLQLLWEYLKLQAELTKMHVIEHKKAYTAATLLVIGSIISYNALKKSKS